MTVTTCEKRPRGRSSTSGRYPVPAFPPKVGIFAVPLPRPVPTSRGGHVQNIESSKQWSIGAKDAMSSLKGRQDIWKYM